VALKLKRLGIANVFPLTGGVEAWLDAGLPTHGASNIAAAIAQARLTDN
jgi:3-mercaptopyruvate sulfurtransferase SseA